MSITVWRVDFFSFFLSSWAYFVLKASVGLFQKATDEEDLRNGTWISLSLRYLCLVATSWNYISHWHQTIMKLKHFEEMLQYSADSSKSILYKYLQHDVRLKLYQLFAENIEKWVLLLNVLTGEKCKCSVRLNCFLAMMLVHLLWIRLWLSLLGSFFSPSSFFPNLTSMLV